MICNNAIFYWKIGSYFLTILISPLFPLDFPTLYHGVDLLQGHFLPVEPIFLLFLHMVVGVVVQKGKELVVVRVGVNEAAVEGLINRLFFLVHRPHVTKYVLIEFT